MSTKFRSGKYYIFSLHAHLVFFTLARGLTLSERIITDLRDDCSRICEGFDTKLIDLAGGTDHIVLHIEFPPTLQLSKLVNSLKGATSRLVKNRAYPELSRLDSGKSFWTRNYYAGSSAEAPSDSIRAFIAKLSAT